MRFRAGSMKSTERSALKVHSGALLLNSTRLIVDSKCVFGEGVVLRGDLCDDPCTFEISKRVILCPEVICKPALLRSFQGFQYADFTIGENVYIGQGSIVQSICVGHGTYIGPRSVLGNGSIIGIGCFIEEGSIIPPGCTIPDFQVVRGVPAKCVGDAPECMLELMRQYTKEYHHKTVIEAE